VRRGAVAFLLGSYLLLGGPAAGPAHGEEGWGYDMAHELMSPFCPGRALAECPSGSADALRAWILAQEEAGVPREEVEARLREQYGDTILQRPEARGVGLVAYAIPVATLLLGGLLLGVFLRRQGPAAGGSDARAPAPGEDPELERRLEEELRASS